jgi:hemerythrin
MKGTVPLTFPEELLIGIRELDDQHRAFYAEIEKLHSAMKAHRLEHVVGMAGYLVDYATVHFEAEERMMIDAGYPGFPEHLVRHGEFKRALVAWRSRLATEGPTASLVVELSSWLTGWLRDHIRRVDAELADFLRRRAAAG